MNNNWHHLLQRIFKWGDMSGYKLVDQAFFINSEGRVYFIITPIANFHPQNFFLEEIVEDKEILDNLDRVSFQFIFKIVGYVRGLRDIPLFELIEIMQLKLSIKVKNLSNKEIEIWDEYKFYHCYNLLSKEDLLNVLQFLVKINKIPDKISDII